MKITSIKVKKIDRENSRLLGVASVILDDEFIIKDICIIKGDNRLFVSMPNKRMPNGSYIDLAHPITMECRQTFEKKIIDEFNKINEE